MEDVNTSAPRINRNGQATTIIVVLNIAIYIFMEMRGGPTYENLIAFGAKENGLIAAGQWYRLLTPMFLHAGLMHLGFNMYALFQVGRVLEMVIGSKNFLIIYFFGGLTASLCSFALSPHLSVGASGSLYAILLALYVLQRYEEKVAKSMGLESPKSPLGMLIVINGLITFVIPNIDWAAHLGGAIAGALCAGSLIATHRWRQRLDKCKRFLDPYSRLPRRQIWEHPRFYMALMLVLNLGFSMKYFAIGQFERAYGLGMLEASQIKEEARSVDQLNTFGKLLTSSKSDAHATKLMRAGLIAHHRGNFLAAFLAYHSAHILSENLPDVLSLSEKIALNQLISATFQRESPQPEWLLTLGMEGIDLAALKEAEDICAQAAELVRSINVFRLSAKLFECAFLLDTSNQSHAIQAFSSLKKSGDERSQAAELARFATVAQSLEHTEASVGDLNPADYWKWVSQPKNDSPAREPGQAPPNSRNDVLPPI